MNRRGIAIVAAVAALLVGVMLWRGHRGSARTVAQSTAGSGAAGGVAVGRTERANPRTQPRGTIAGTITADDTHAPIAGARVCARLYSDALSGELIRDPICTVADPSGHYALKDLYSAEYQIAAAAKPYRPGVYRLPGPPEQTTFPLAPGEAKTGINVVLRTGGVELTGVVQDVSGGPIAHALVTARHGWDDELVPPVETDDSGTFSVYVAPGNVSVEAVADGYARGNDGGQAPGSVTILLTPESSVAGKVVDAVSGAPVPGVRVRISEALSGWFDMNDGASDITDEQGAFRITRLQPGRYTLKASAAHGLGMSDGSTLVGLGQHVDGVIVKLHPGFQVSGTVMLPNKTPCEKPSMSLTDSPRGRDVSATVEPSHEVHADGVLAGTYKIDVSCGGYVTRPHYDPIKVVDKDLTGLVWEVDAGSTFRGRVLTKAGAPIEHATVNAHSVGGAARERTHWGGATSARDGTFEMTGLSPGSFKIDVDSEVGVSPKDGWTVEVTAGAPVSKDLVLDDTGTITGTVVDTDGKAVSEVNVHAESLDGGWGGWQNVRTRPDGTFHIDNLAVGSYRVTASHHAWSDDLRKPGSTDDDKQGEKATVTIGKPANVRLVVESQSGVIKGIVADAAGTPVADAFISVARESDAAGARTSGVASTRWTWGDKPVLSNVDGSFSVGSLGPGKYTVRAYRKGGGEAVEEHVALGTTTHLVIRATGGIEGTVKQPSGAAIERLTIELLDDKSGFRRSETFFRTGGVFKVDELPAGHFLVTATAEGGKRQTPIDLGEGEHKAGLELVLEELVTLTGHLVDQQTKAPVPGIRMFAGLAKGTNRMAFGNDSDEQPNITDSSGAFMIENVPRGKLRIIGVPKDLGGDGDYGWVQLTRDVSGTGTVDIGELPILKKRLKDGQPKGEIGIHFAEPTPGLDPDQQKLEVSYIDPAGPAAKLDLKVGDVVTTIDGIDVVGNRSNAFTLMRAPAGTVLKLGLARGNTVTVTLVAP